MEYAYLVAPKSGFGLSDHPVCGAKVGFAEIFLMPQPPLLTRPHEEGSAPSGSVNRCAHHLFDFLGFVHFHYLSSKILQLGH